MQRQHGLVSGPSHGTLQFNGDGSFTYTPNAGFVGTDSFQYDATDGLATSNPAPVTITVDETVPQSLPNSQPSAVAVADFTNDGLPDVAMADQGRNTVSIYADGSNDDLTATPISTTPVGSAPVALVAGNFGNGQQDLAVVNSGDGTVSILLGNGDGTFTTSQVIDVGANPEAISAGNFLGNGVVDLAVANKGSNTISFLLNNGSGTFALGSTISTGNAPDAVAEGDFNGDGKDDLVVANSADNTVSILLSNGDGTFAPAVNYAVGVNPSSVTTGDFDGDGCVDLAVADSGSNDVDVLLGNDDGTFQAATSYGVGADPVSVVAGNFSGIEDVPGIDLAVVNEGSNTLTILSGLSTGVAMETALQTASGPRGMALGDFDKDGQLQGVVVAKTVAGNGQLAFAKALPEATNREQHYDYWHSRAFKQIKLGSVTDLTSKTWLLFNKRITGAYASLFVGNASRYPWLGLASYASDQVGTTIGTLKQAWMDANKTNNPFD